jgi:hypothetical protein
LKADHSSLAAVAEETVVPNVEPPGEPAGTAADAEPSAAHIYFKDLKLLAHDNDTESDGEYQDDQISPFLASEEGSSPTAPSPTSAGTTPRPQSRRKLKRVDRQRLVIILVGLPARGKTFLCNKLMCYFSECS